MRESVIPEITTVKILRPEARISNGSLALCFRVSIVGNFSINNIGSVTSNRLDWDVFVSNILGCESIRFIYCDLFIYFSFRLKLMNVEMPSVFSIEIF